MLRYEVEWHPEEGCLAYYRHDQLHRIGNPAVVWDDQERSYYQYGKYHRIDGPARIMLHGASQIWYHRGYGGTTLQEE
jgi:hypothetical protein